MCKKTSEEILNDLKSLNLTFSEKFLEQMYGVLRTKYKEFFDSKEILPNISILEELKIDSLFAYINKVDTPGGTAGIRGAIELQNDPLMSRLISSLALAKINDDDIELIVNGKFNISYTHEDVAQFLHYFFNVKDWTIGEKTEYVKHVPAEDPRKLFYKIALEGDKDYLVWKLGAAPDKSFDSMLRDMMSDAYYNFKEKSKRAPEEAQKWAQVALKVTDKLDKLEDDSRDKKDIFEELEFVIKATPKKVRHLKEIENE